MKVTLLSCNSPEYAPLAALTDPTKADYAKRWGYEFRAVVDPELATKRCPWRRVELWIEHLKTSDWLFFTGTDAAITNPDIEINPGLNADLYIAVDGNGLQCDSWIMRNGPVTRDFLHRVLLRRGSSNNEQDAMCLELAKARTFAEFSKRTGLLEAGGAPATQRLMDVLQRELNRSDVKVRLVPQKELNAYPNELYSGRPGGANQWDRSSLVCHIPGKTLAFRLKHFPRYLEHLYGKDKSQST